MRARLRKLISELRGAFWLVPAAMSAAGIFAAIGLVELDRSDAIPIWLIENAWLYNGAGSGARSLLSAVATSTIAVAGTAFSITIAGLSLAAGQMGPRLLRNFTRDRGNQITLGAFLGTFCYALMVLRSVRGESEGPFVPPLSMSVAIGLSFVCVAMLVYFVEHMASRINVDTVADLVSRDLGAAIKRRTTTEPQPEPPPEAFWHNALPITDSRRGYLQHLDEESLEQWAVSHKTSIRLLVRPGDYVFPGAPIAFITPAADGADAAIRAATALGTQRTSAEDLEFAVRQLVEVAVRALSPGINDPHTAISVLDRLGAALCDLSQLRLPSGVLLQDGWPALVVPAIDYDGLVDAMFHMIRQNAAGKPAVLIRILEVLTAVVGCDRDPERAKTLQRHADLVLADAGRSIQAPADLNDLRGRYAAFEAARRHSATGPPGQAIGCREGPDR